MWLEGDKDFMVIGGNGWMSLGYNVRLCFNIRIVLVLFVVL